MDSTKKHITKKQRILSFCYGYGGLERGISKVIPTRVAAYVEIEAFQNFNLVAAMESGLVDKAPIWTNLKTFDGKPFHKRVHGIIGGYPCQGESLAGKRKLWNDERFLWPYIERSIIDIRPLWCFFENVAGHLTGSFPYILDSLRTLGYSVESGLFTASEIGAPHQRKRLFILAMDNAYINELQAQRERRLAMDGDLLQNSRWQENTIGFGKTSKQLDDSTDSGSSKVISNPDHKRRNGNSFPGGHEKEITGTTVFRENVPHSTSKRDGESSKEFETRKFIHNGNKWPVEPGQEQNSWESKRAVKPGLGCTINGYNFRTELLRQYGNGVVSQTAEKAFSLLLDKHIKNTKLV